MLSQETIDQIISLNAAENTDRGIAAALGINHKTVALHRRKNGLQPNGVARRPLQLIDKDNARCSRCHEIKPLDNWPTAREGKKYAYRLSYCRDCRRNQARVAANRTSQVNIRSRWSRLKTRASSRGLPFSISWDDFWSQWLAQDGKCFYTSSDMLTDYGQGKSPYACSVDKIEPHLGYITGNVVFACDRVNTIKRDVTIDELRQWMPGWYAKVCIWRAASVCAQVADGNF